MEFQTAVPPSPCAEGWRKQHTTQAHLVGRVRFCKRASGHMTSKTRIFDPVKTSIPLRTTSSNSQPGKDILIKGNPWPQGSCRHAAADGSWTAEASTTPCLPPHLPDRCCCPQGRDVWSTHESTPNPTCFSTPCFKVTWHQSWFTTRGVEQTATGTSRFSHLMVIHCCIPKQATSLGSHARGGWRSLLEASPGRGGGLDLSAQAPTCALSTNLLQTSKNIATWGRIHRGRTYAAAEPLL